MLRLADVRKRYGAVEALAGCSFAVERGRILGFLGPNGAGKTTAMRAIVGIVRPDGGALLWDGAPIGGDARLSFGYMPEERGLYPRMPVGEQVAFFGRLHGMRATAARTATTEWLDRLGLAERAGARVEELSHGNQQRAQLAVALVHRPALLVLDEPFAGLDPVAVQALAELLRAEAERGAAVLFSSHQLELVEDICPEVAIIDHGRVLATGVVDELRRASRRRVIELRLEGAPPDWTPASAEVELLERRDGRLKLAVRSDVDPGRVLAEAERSASVVDFTYGPPSLSELFLELVAR